MMLPSSEVTIAAHDRLPPAEVVERAADGYLAGFSDAPYFETSDHRADFIDRVRRYSVRDGFRLIVATRDDTCIGIGLAVIGHPGDWWRDQVAAHLTEEEAGEWLGAAVLELVHLAVAPTARGRGVGSAIHDELLAGASPRAAVLTVDLRAAPARALYAARGWRPLREAVSIAGGPPGTLMVRPLDGLPVGRTGGLEARADRSDASG